MHIIIGNSLSYYCRLNIANSQKATDMEKKEDCTLNRSQLWNFTLTEVINWVDLGWGGGGRFDFKNALSCCNVWCVHRTELMKIRCLTFLPLPEYLCTFWTDGYHVQQSLFRTETKHNADWVFPKLTFNSSSKYKVSGGGGILWGSREVRNIGPPVC